MGNQSYEGARSPSIPSDLANANTSTQIPNGSESARPRLPLWLRFLLYALIIAGIYVVAPFAYFLATLLIAAFLSVVALVPSSDVVLKRPELEVVFPFYRALLVLGVTGLFWCLMDRRPWREFGLRRIPARTALLAAGIGLAPFAILGLVCFSTGDVRFHGLPLASHPAALYSLSLWLIVVLSIGLAEETAFNGWLLPNLAERVRRQFAVLISVVLFSAVHWINGDMTLYSFWNRTLTGLGLAWMRLGTASLTFPIIAHAAFDFGHEATAGISSSEETFPPLYEVEWSKASWLGRTEGAVFLLSSIVQVAWLAAIWWWIYRPSLQPPRVSRENEESERLAA